MNGTGSQEPRLGEGNRPGEEELLKLAVNNPILHAIFSQHLRGLCTYTEALAAATITLAKQNAHLMKAFHNAAMNLPRMTSLDIPILNVELINSGTPYDISLTGFQVEWLETPNGKAKTP